MENRLQVNFPNTPLFVSLNCTHYGYSLSLWEKAFQSLGRTPEAFLDPNSRMIQFLFRQDLKGRAKNPQVTVRMVSMVKIGEDVMSSIGQWLSELSPETAEALQNYEYKENLFAWKEFVTSKR